MIIEVWSDFVCPFCYIGKRRLELALEQFEHKDSVEIEFKSFELDPHAGVYNGKSIHEALSEKYGMSIEQAKVNNLQIGQHAAEVGLTFNFDEMKPTNTLHAHRLAKFAETKGKEKAMTENLLYAYFTESKNLSDKETLLDVAEASGLDRKEATEILDNESLHLDEVRGDERMAQQYGITGVPFFILNNKYTISGAQPMETFVGALNQVWKEENEQPKFKDFGSGNAGVCTDDNCSI
ncbi:DsbA family oxidoreductase [Terribacillus saccharophilus]|uniref:Disulfide bond formation protein DsbA n=1 Tax=Terribacillus saccharophilus TaxID=361277 RepID=A0A268ADR6_9BACI|nr:DsbA family oxidoreductase [Terribacillus saccharophilus]PAD22266.1 disulfide bond formation protein DsbA [Terribacillus saccharophilus]